MKSINLSIIIAIGIIFSLGFASALTTNLTGYWKFNDTAVDSSGKGNNAVTVGSPTFMSGKLGNATNVTYTSQFNMWNVSTGKNNWTFGTNNFTVAYWFNVPPSGKMFVENFDVGNWAGNNGWALYIRSTGAITFVSVASDKLATGSYNDNTWHRVVVVRRGLGDNNSSAYVDGINIANDTIGDNLDYVNDLTIGRSGPGEGSTTAIKGLLDDLRVYNGYAWTVADVGTDWNGGNGREADDPVIYSILNSPSTGLYTSNSTIIFNSTIVPSSDNLVNATLYIWNSTSGNIFNRTTNLLTGNLSNNTAWNISNFAIGDYTWNVYGCGSVVCGWASSNSTFSYGFTIYNNSLNTSAYETESQSFLLNLSLASGLTLSSVSLNYNGTSYSTTLNNPSSGDYLATRTIDIPTGAGLKNIFWSLLYSTGLQQNTSVSTQTVTAINLSLCGSAPQNVPFINFTFKDETTLSSLTALVDSSDWTYYLGSGGVTKTLNYASTTLSNPSYAFCFSPGGRAITTDLTFRYSNTSYPQRLYSLDDDSLTNTTTNQVLYLLGSADGLYSSIQTAENSGATISGVLLVVEREISGVWTTISQSNTGSDGLATFWVNPNFPHRITATKTGYTSAQVTITPSQSVYTLVMSSSSGDATYNGSLAGMKWKITPASGRLDAGSQTFGFNLTADLSNLDGNYCQMQLVNAETDAVLSSTTGGDASGCNLSLTYTITNDLKILGKFYVDTTDTSGFTLIDGDAYWLVMETNVTTWTTLWGFFDDMKDLPEFGDGLRQEYSRVVFFFFMLFLFIGVMTYFTGYDFSSPGSALLVVAPLILFVSFTGWFNFDNLTNYTWINKYAVALITLFWTTGYILNVVGRQ